MNWEKYQVVFREDTEGENSIGESESWYSLRTCDVMALQGLKEGEDVPFTPEHFGRPNITFLRLTDKAVELTFHDYDGPEDDFMTAHKFTLTPGGEAFSSFNGMGRYSSTYTIRLDEKK